MKELEKTGKELAELTKNYQRTARPPTVEEMDRMEREQEQVEEREREREGLEDKMRVVFSPSEAPWAETSHTPEGILKGREELLLRLPQQNRKTDFARKTLAKLECNPKKTVKVGR